MAHTDPDARATCGTKVRQRANERAPSSADLVALLSQTSAYPDRPKQVAIRETHISWVFLTDRFVYKLKKPVRFDFLDFSTSEARRRACQAECDLNERLAPAVYLGVLPITLDGNGRLALNGQGQAVDWVVKMRRLPAARMLDELIRTGQLSDQDGERLAAWLAKYYHRLSPICVGASERRKAIEQRVRDNRSELLDPAHQLSANAVKRCHAAQMRFMALESDQFDERVCDGRIVDGHGDLRPEHICLESQPIVFDCIEFNDELRKVDVVDELAFLAMECDFLGADRLGRLVVDAYRTESHDQFSPALWDFYKCYRACVRAKVAALRAAQSDPTRAGEDREQARKYLSLADQYAGQLGPATVIVVCGLMGSGKTTLATALASLLGSDYLSTDVIRRHLLGASPSPAGFNQGHYTPELHRRVYLEMLRQAESLLHERVSVVLDGAFLTAALRNDAIALARASGATPLIVHCVCPAEVALERIERRAAEPNFSEARTELYPRQQSAEEPFSRADAIEIDTNVPLRLQETAILADLRIRLAPQRRPQPRSLPAVGSTPD